ncbi:unnamed protein product, partial [Urochloa humidicola]
LYLSLSPPLVLLHPARSSSATSSAPHPSSAAPSPSTVGLLSYPGAGGGSGNFGEGYPAAACGVTGSRSPSRIREEPSLCDAFSLVQPRHHRPAARHPSLHPSQISQIDSSPDLGFGLWRLLC